MKYIGETLVCDRCGEIILALIEIDITLGIHVGYVYLKKCNLIQNILNCNIYETFRTIQWH